MSKVRATTEAIPFGCNLVRMNLGSGDVERIVPGAPVDAKRFAAMIGRHIDEEIGCFSQCNGNGIKELVGVRSPFAQSHHCLSEEAYELSLDLLSSL